MDFEASCIWFINTFMKKAFLLTYVMFLTILSSAQVERKIESQITNVTVFLSKAQVTRESKARIEAGKTNLILTGLTSLLDPQSIQVTGKGDFILLGITHQQNYLNEQNLPVPLQIVKDSLEQLEHQLVLQSSQKEILNKEEQMLFSNQKIGGANQNLSVLELKGMADFYRSRLSDIVISRMKIDEKIKKLNEKVVKLQRQMKNQNELYMRNTSEIIISVSANAQTDVSLELNYVVANAGWYPQYDLRAVNTKSPVQLNYKANVYQSTGEEWKNVQLKLSTANPAQGGLKPELYTWYVDFYQPRPRSIRKDKSARMPSAARDMEVVEEMEGEVALPAPSESAADYVATVQTSINTEFNIGLPYTISSSNKPTLVEIGTHELKADYAYAVAPKLDADAFLMASVIGWEEFSLLPGEANVFFEGTFVGKTYVDPNSIKDTLAVSLGRDKRISVKRDRLKDYNSRKLIGANQRESFAYEVTVRNNKNESSKISIEDQIPISQNSQIEITTGDLSGGKYNKDTGKLTWEMNLQPNEIKKVIYKFEVKYPKDAIVSGL
jgi:uncharacterized protein (TIGR02231 family)